MSIRRTIKRSMERAQQEAEGHRGHRSGKSRHHDIPHHDYNTDRTAPKLIPAQKMMKATGKEPRTPREKGETNA